MAYILIKRTEIIDKEAGIIHVTEIRRERDPSTYQYEIQFDEPIQEQAPKVTKYKKIELDLTPARTEKEIIVTGDSFIFLGANGNFAVKFGDISNDVLTQDDLHVGVPVSLSFGRVFITNVAQAGKSAKFLIL